MRDSDPASTRFRRLVLSALMVFAPLVATAAAAWACGPQAHLTLDKLRYETGSTIVATGGHFPPSATVSVTLGDSSPTPWTTTVTASQNGAFTVTLKAPMTPGNYTLTASSPRGRVRARALLGLHSPASGFATAASTRMQARGAVPLVELRPKAFRADAGTRVQIRFHLKARALRALKAARRVRMRGTVVAVGANGTATTKSFVFTLKAPRASRRASERR